MYKHFIQYKELLLEIFQRNINHEIKPKCFILSTIKYNPRQAALSY